MLRHQGLCTQQHEVDRQFEEALKKPECMMLLVVVMCRYQDAERFRGNGTIQ